ncbi:hypothetical protein D3C72_1392330 [compost metagenome]
MRVNGLRLLCQAIGSSRVLERTIMAATMSPMVKIFNLMMRKVYTVIILKYQHNGKENK